MCLPRSDSLCQVLQNRHLLDSPGLYSFRPSNFDGADREGTLYDRDKSEDDRDDKEDDTNVEEHGMHVEEDDTDGPEDDKDVEEDTDGP